MSTFKITYSTPSAPPEEMHRGYEAAVESVRAELGKTHPIWIGDRAVRDRPTFENRSPIDRNVLIGNHQEATTADTEAAIAIAFRLFGNGAARPGGSEWQFCGSPPSSSANGATGSPP